MQYAVEKGELSGPKLLPEEKLILQILQRGFDGVKYRDAIAMTSLSRIKWDNVFETVLEWNVAPMLYPLVRGGEGPPDVESIPHTVWKSMEAAYIKTHMVNQSYFLELTSIVKRLAAADIQVLLLKGAHLAPFVYTDFGMRWMADIDILIKKESMEKAHEYLLRMGYEHPELGNVVWDDFGEQKRVRDPAAVIDWYKTHHMHLIYRHPEAIQRIEVHWGIVRSTNPFNIDTEGLWERAMGKEMNGQRVWVLSPEDLLLHISVHDSYYHKLRPFGLRPCCDVAAIVGHFFEEIDWRRLQQRSREWGIERHLYLMLRLSQKLLGVDIPADFFACMEDAACHDRIIRHAIARILGKETERPSYRGMRYPSEVHIFAQDQEFFKKAGFFLKKMPISRDEIAARYALPVDSRRYWLYYLARIASLILAYARIYVPYIWYLLRHGFRHSEDYSLDLWLTSPNPRS